MNHIIPIVCATAIVGVFVGRSYIHEWVLQYFVKQTEYENNHITHNAFTIDRLLDGDCNGKPLFIGIVKKQQGIRWGDSDDIKHLISVKQTIDRILYEFEDQYILEVSKNTYTFKTPNAEITKPLFDVWKPIGFLSVDLDKIGHYVNGKN